ncbi:MAG: geranylgeranylglyceryl/heptaprenylglyceryl phosphate synthase, partial [bacterium]|nr:geranylgeranylglyceryl/heptaprenylglyceryl phosphate synthase [bacterium]
SLAAFANTCEAQGADGILIGGSLLLDDGFDKCVEAVKRAVRIPVILFPGNGRQLSRYADAVLFMSLVSGRNPHLLIGEQVTSAPVIRAMGLEPVSMAYLLVESGETTAAEFMSATRPIPRNKPDIAAAHALAAEYLGMKLVYLEAGSGAKQSVPEAMIAAVARTVSVPVIVGGGIRAPEDAAAKVKAGASFVVTGNVLEKEGGPDRVRSLADAVHASGAARAGVHGTA